MEKLITKDSAHRIMDDCDSIDVGEVVPVDNKVRMTRVQKGAVKRFALLGSPSRIRRTFASIL